MSKKSSKKTNAVAEPTTPAAPAAPAQELPAVPVEDAKKPVAVAVAPSTPAVAKFAKRTLVRYRGWDIKEGPLDREGTVTGSGPKWITINRTIKYENGEVVIKQDWADARKPDSIEAIAPKAS